MEIKQLQSFLTTVQVGSISKAADVLFISQPALSRTIGRLETELGFSLFERGHTGIRLTPQGEILYHGTEQIMTILEESVHAAKQTADVGDEAVAIACAFEDFDNQIIYQFHKKYPSIHTRFSLLPPQESLNQVLSGNAIMAIVPWMDFPDTVQWLPLLKEEMLLSTGREHPLFGRQSVALSELDGCTVVCNDVVFDEDTLRGICAHAGIQMKFSFRGNEHQQVGALKFLLNSMMFIPCCALLQNHPLDEQGLQLYGPPTPPARIQPPVFQREIGIIYRKNKFLHSAELNLISSITRYYTELGHQDDAFLRKHYT